MKATGLLVRLKERRFRASPAERNIIEYIQQNIRSVVAKSIRDLADATYTSPSTVVRFCRKLGCDGYKEFQRELVYELASLDDAGTAVLEDISQQDSTDVIVTKVMRSNIASVEATARLIDRTTLERCAELIACSRVVDLFGFGASLLVAHDLEMKLTRTDKECHVTDDWHNQLLRAKNMHPDDLAIVISYSGLTDEAIQCASQARLRGAQVIAITRISEDSALAHLSDWVLGVAASEPLVRSGAMASRMSQLMVIDALFIAYVTKDYERCTATMRRNYNVKKL